MHSSRMRTVRSSGRISWGGINLVRGDVPGLGDVYLVLGVYLVWGCTWSGGVYLVWGGVPGPWGVPGPGGVPCLGGCTWSWGVYLVRGGTWSGGVYLVQWGTCSEGAPGLGGYLVPGGVLVRYSPPVDRHTPVKT